MRMNYQHSALFVTTGPQLSWCALNDEYSATTAWVSRYPQAPDVQMRRAMTLLNVKFLAISKC